VRRSAKSVIPQNISASPPRSWRQLNGGGDEEATRFILVGGAVRLRHLLPRPHRCLLPLVGARCSSGGGRRAATGCFEATLPSQGRRSPAPNTVSTVTRTEANYWSSNPWRRLTLQMGWKPNYIHITPFSWEKLYEPIPLKTTTTTHQSNPNIWVHNIITISQTMVTTQ